MPEERKEIIEKYKVYHSQLKDLYKDWKDILTVLGMRNIPPLPLLYDPGDYREYAAYRAPDLFSEALFLSRRKKRILKQKEAEISSEVSKILDEYYERVFREPPDNINDHVQRRVDELVQSMANKLNVKDEEKIKRLADRLYYFLTPKIVVYEDGTILSAPFDDFLLRDKYNRTIGLQNALQLLLFPGELINKFSEEDITDIMEKPEKYELLFHHNAPHVVDHAKRLKIPLKDVLEFLHRHPHRELLITSAHNLPSILFHPEILEHTSRLGYNELKNILFPLAQLSPLLKGEKTSTVKKLIEALRQETDLYDVITHPTLLRNVDLLLHLYRKNKKIAKEISKRLDDLDNHNNATLRSLIQAALEGDEHLLPLLLPHPGLHQHYRVLLSSNLSRDLLEGILSHKDNWKDMDPSHVEKLLRTPIGRRLLISSLPKEKKIELLKNLQDLTEKDIVVHELAHGYDVPVERVRKVLEELGPERTENFLRTYGDVVSILKDPGFYALLELAQSGSLSKRYGKAVAYLDRARFLTSMPIVRIVKALEQEGLLDYFLSMNPSRVERFLRYPSRDVDSIVENIRYMRKLNQSIPVSHPSQKKKRMTPRNFKSEEDLRNFIKSNIARLGKRRVILRGELVGALGTNKNHMTREEFERKLRKWLRMSRIRNRSLDDKRIENILNDILGSERRQPLKYPPATESAPEITRLKEEDIGRIKSILDSIYEALKNREVLIHDMGRDYITFRILKNTHHSKVLLSKELRSRSSNVAGTSTTKGSNYVRIPLTFFKNLTSHPDLMTHPLLTLLFQRVKKELTRKRKGR